MSIYKELDTIIADHIGYSEEGYEYCNRTGMTFPNYECADIELYNSIVDECSRYTKGKLPYKHLSTDAKACIKVWRNFLKTYKENFVNLS